LAGTSVHWLAAHPPSPPAAQEFQYLPPSIATSAEDGTGKVQLLHFIAALRVAAESGGLRRPPPVAPQTETAQAVPA
jgi:hypothetical protein